MTLADLLAAPLPSPFETPQTALPAVDGALDEAVAPFPVAEATHAAKTVGPLADVAPLATPAVETVPIVAANDAHEPLVGAPTKTGPAEFAPAEASSVVLTAPGLAVDAAAPVQTDPALTALDPDFTPPDQALGVRDTLARAKASRRAGLGELVTFLAMGALGMVSLGVAAAAFQRASATRSGDTATVAWVLALIAVACIGVSAYNLYRRWGRPDRG